MIGGAISPTTVATATAGRIHAGRASTVSGSTGR